jgi:molybdate transport system substrate-binding protein
VSEEDDVKGVVGKVSLGEADAGFVYVTDVKPVEDKVTAVELPEEAQAVVEYEIAVVRDAPHGDAAQQFVDRVLGDEGQSELRAAGFGSP